MNLEALGIASKNIEESIKFYGAFGVEFSKLGDEHYEGVTSSGVRLMLDSVDLMRKINPDWSYREGSNITLCHKCASSSDVDELFSKIITLGFESIKSPWDAFWGQRYASVRDPDGNQIDIFAELKSDV